LKGDVIMAEESKLLITKVKLDDHIFIGYTRKTETHSDVRTSKCNEPARPELYKAFVALGKHAAHILGLTETTQILRLAVHTVNFTYELDGRMGAQMCCTYKCPNGEETNINTPPMKCPQSATEFNNGKYFGEDAVRDLWVLESEARKYLEGKRAQTQLFDDEAKANEAESTKTKIDDFDEDDEEDISDSDALDEADNIAAVPF